MLGVKHIRGILLDDEQLKPEELRALARKDDGNEKVDLEARFGPLGRPLPNGLYLCTLCNDYNTKGRADMRDHLYRELKYVKFQCAHCDKKSCSKSYLLKHIPRFHPTEQTPSSVVVLPIEEDIEEWVEQLLKTQGELMKIVDNQPSTSNKQSSGKTVGHAQQSTTKSPAKSTAKQAGMPRKVAKPAAALKVPSPTKPPATAQAPVVAATTAKPTPPEVTPSRVVPIQADGEEEIDVTGSWSWEDRVTVATLPPVTIEPEVESDPEVSILAEEPSIIELTDSECNSPSKKRRRLPPKRFPCAHCGEKFGTIRGLKSHIKLNHLAMGRWRCNVCKGTHNSEIFMKKHCSSKHPGVADNPYVLNPNASKILSDAWWNENYNIDQLEKDFELPSTSSDSPVTGVEKSTGTENPLLCEESQVKKCAYCEFKCKSSSEMRRHEMRHWTQKPFRCGHCDFDAIRQFEIKKHSAKIHPFKSCCIVKVDIPLHPDIRPIKTKRKPDVMDDADDSSEVSLPQIEDSFSIDALSDSNVGKEEEEHLQIFKCHYCPFRGNAMRVVYDHWQSLHQNKVVLANGNVKTGTGLVFKCRKINIQEESDNGNTRQMLFTCGYCKKRGSRSVLTEHQQEAHPGKPFSIAHLPVIKYECTVCKFQSNTSVTMKKHWSCDHSSLPFHVIVSQEKSSSRLFKPDDFTNAKYLCIYCTEQLDTINSMVNHLADYHSHLELRYAVKGEEILPDTKPEPVEFASPEKRKPFVKKYKCPLCVFTAIEHRYVKEHLRRHARPVQCCYCVSTFDFVNKLQAHSLREHPNMKISWKSLDAIEEEYQGLVLQITTVEEEVSEEKKQKRSVARKSTTLAPRSSLKQVARKSTTPYPRQKHESVVCDEEDIEYSDDGIEQSPSPNLPEEFSFYGSKPVKENFENLKTHVQFGPNIITITVDAMLKGINIAPTLAVKDVKNASSQEIQDIIRHGSSY